MSNFRSIGSYTCLSRLTQLWRGADRAGIPYTTDICPYRGVPLQYMCACSTTLGFLTADPSDSYTGILFCSALVLQSNYIQWERFESIPLCLITDWTLSEGGSLHLVSTSTKFSANIAHSQVHLRFYNDLYTL